MQRQITFYILAFAGLLMLSNNDVYGQNNNRSSKSGGSGDTLAVNMLAKLDQANLSDKQIAEIKRLASVYGPKAWEIRKPAKITAEQRAAMVEARKSGAKAGKAGSELTSFVHTAANLTDEQIKALKDAGKIYREFQEKAYALLSNRQLKSAGIEIKSKKSKPENSKPKVIPATKILPAPQP